MGGGEPYEVIDLASVLPFWGKPRFKSKLETALDDKKYEFCDLLHSSLCDGGADGPVEEIYGITVLDASDQGEEISAEVQIEIKEESYLQEKHVGVLHVAIQKATGRATVNCYQAESEYSRDD